MLSGQRASAWVRLPLLGMAAGLFLCWMILLGAKEPTDDVVYFFSLDSDYGTVTHPSDGIDKPDLWYVSEVTVTDGVYCIQVCLPYGYLGSTVGNDIRFDSRQQTATMKYGLQGVTKSVSDVHTEMAEFQRDEDGNIRMNAIFLLPSVDGEESSVDAPQRFLVSVSLRSRFEGVSRAGDFVHGLCKGILQAVSPEHLRLRL